MGAGTGAFTEAIIAKLGPEDHLDIVEINPTLCKILRRKFEHHPNVAIHALSIVDFKAEPYHAIISGLPLHSFQSQLVRQILKQFEQLTQEGRSLSLNIWD